MSLEKKPKAEAVVGDDRLSALPDDLLHKVMSFLRACEVLSRRWRNLWAFAPCVDLRVCCKARHRLLSMRFVNFTNHFFLLREASTTSCSCRRRLRRWTPSGSCPSPCVKTFRGCPTGPDMTTTGRTTPPRISKCGSVLELKECHLDGPHISSASLISLSMVECRIMRDLTVAAPNLVSLCCVNPYHRAPSFENMPSLATGTIMLNDSFLHDDFEETYTQPDPEVILNRELEMFPIFSNLKTLSLGDWCMADLHPLVLFLRHAPNMERLFLELKMDHEEMDDDIKPEGRSFACKNLTMVNIKCHKEDERVPLLAQFFVANGVAMEKISVYHRPTRQT
uniref:F-box domain-containing protein n=1 Tax=Hordeum vulgare subsp. vulgare TaxID=112509 RepID=A0A8I6YHB1_HORVV